MTLRICSWKDLRNLFEKLLSSPRDALDKVVLGDFYGPFAGVDEVRFVPEVRDR